MARRVASSAAAAADADAAATASSGKSNLEDHFWGAGVSAKTPAVVMGASIVGSSPMPDKSKGGGTALRPPPPSPASMLESRSSRGVDDEDTGERELDKANMNDALKVMKQQSDEMLRLHESEVKGKSSAVRSV